jgi:ribosome-binding factor A
MSIKSNRVASDMQRHISQILREEIKNPKVKLVTITAIELTNDLAYAKVYFTTLSKIEREVVEKELNKSANYIKTELGHRMQFRKNPTLHFEYDESIEYGQHIEDIISKL